MGDKSPKSKERNRKQDVVRKEKQKADAFSKAHPAPAEPAKKGK